MQVDGLGKISGMLFCSQNGGAILANTNWFREPSGADMYTLASGDDALLHVVQGRYMLPASFQANTQDNASVR